MRVSVPSIAVLSLGLSNSHAFSPPTSAVSVCSVASSSKSRLHASKELSSLLQEYSGSTSTLPPPQSSLPPQPIVSTEAADSAMESLMKAASVAQDAADQAAAAAAAAASVVAKSAAATKAAAVGTSVVGGFQFKPLGDIFVPVDPAKTNPDLAFDASARARENLDVLKANFLGGVKSVTEGLGDGQSTTSSFDTTNLPNIGSLSVPALDTILASLHFNEYGGWYAAGALAIIASQQRSAGKEDASATFESELASARAKAKEAAEAAALAAQGANTAKTLAIKMEQDLKKTGGNALLENSRSKMAQTEKASIQFFGFV